VLVHTFMDVSELEKHKGCKQVNIETIQNHFFKHDLHKLINLQTLWNQFSPEMELAKSSKEKCR